MKYIVTLSDDTTIVMSPAAGVTINKAVADAGLNVQSWQGVADDYLPARSPEETFEKVATKFNELRQADLNGFPADDMTLSLALAKLGRMADGSSTTWTKSDGSIVSITKAEIEGLVDAYLARTEALKTETLLIRQAVQEGEPVPEHLKERYEL